jgi:hypothetical protein
VPVDADVLTHVFVDLMDCSAYHDQGLNKLRPAQLAVGYLRLVRVGVRHTCQLSRKLEAPPRRGLGKGPRWEQEQERLSPSGEALGA